VSRDAFGDGHGFRPTWAQPPAQKPVVVPLPQPTVSEDITAVIEQINAEEGSLVAIAVSMVRRDGSSTTAFHADEQIITLMGSVAMLQHRLAEAKD